MRRLAAMALVAGGLAQGQDPGLVASVGDARHAVKLVVASPSFHLRAEESLHPSIESAFEAEWRGQISILQAGEYSFDSGGAEVSIAGRRVAAQPMRLTAGRHPVLIRYRRQPGPAALQLRWKSEHFPLEPVPSSVFVHERAENPDALAEQGRDLAEELGCVNCHAASGGSLQGRLGPDLTGAGSRLDPRWVEKWLEKPSAFRAGAVMPALAGEQERRDVTSFLASVKAPTPPRAARKASRNELVRGNQLFGALGCAACHRQEQLSLDGVGSKTTPQWLMEFLKNPARFDPGGRMPSMLLTDEEAFALAGYLAEKRNTAFEQPAGAGDAARGKRLLESEGCLACHRLQGAEPLENRQRAPELAAIQPDRGCLAATPGRGVPQYDLTAAQRQALTTFLASYGRHPDVSRAPVYELARRLRQLRCVACHATDLEGATVALADATPTLVDAGAKLRTPWMEQVMTGRGRARTWLDLRMPDYDARQVGPMAASFAAAAGVEPGDGSPAPASSEAHRKRGAGMIGTDPGAGGLACIGCHDWGTYKSLGEEAPQLINTTQRLRWEWFERWMRNPARILSGTSMPNYFSSMDPQRASQTILSLWGALELGEKLPLPAGLGRIEASLDAEARPVAAGREAVVIRWDMPEATPAAIAVGLPGGISYCFDAGESRLRYAWSGGFLDMSGTLLSKVDETGLTATAKIIGQIFFRSQEFPLRIGASERIPQRRFRGYRLVAGIPELHYQLDGIDVWERIEASGGGIERVFRISRVEETMWFLDGEKRQIPRGANVSFRVRHQP